jgi:translation initiation factor IF-3
MVNKLLPQGTVEADKCIVVDFFCVEWRTATIERNLRINEQIRITPLRVVDAEGGMLGILPREEALSVARQANLDLVEVAPSSRPPVCRVMDYGKFKYDQKKKQAKQRQHAHHTQMKEIRLRPKIGENDLMVKVKRAHDFLAQKHKVLMVVLFRGREMAHVEQGRQVLETAVKQLEGVSKVEKMPGMEGKRMTTVLSPK